VSHPLTYTRHGRVVVRNGRGETIVIGGAYRRGQCPRHNGAVYAATRLPVPETKETRPSKVVRMLERGGALWPIGICVFGMVYALVQVVVRALS
jgi:hypothetical protein